MGIKGILFDFQWMYIVYAGCLHFCV